MRARPLTVFVIHKAHDGNSKVKCGEHNCIFATIMFGILLCATISFSGGKRVLRSPCSCSMGLTIICEIRLLYRKMLLIRSYSADRANFRNCAHIKIPYPWYQLFGFIFAKWVIRLFWVTLYNKRGIPHFSMWHLSVYFCIACIIPPPTHTHTHTHTHTQHTHTHARAFG